MNRTNYPSNRLNHLTRELNAIRNNLYFEFYKNNSEFKSAIDFRREGKTGEDIRGKIQSLFCFNRETECIMAFKDFYLNSIDPQLHDTSSFIPFFDGLYIYTGGVYVRDAETTIMTSIKADLEDIITKYNSTNTIQFKHKPIEMEDTLIPHAIFNNILDSVNRVNRMSSNEIIDELKPLKVDDILITPLINILTSQPKEITLNFDQLTYIHDQVKMIYNKVIQSVISQTTQETYVDED